jgi:putative ABC transport system ATP-binding protein
MVSCLAFDFRANQKFFPMIDDPIINSGEPPAISVRGLRFSYQNGSPILDIPTWDVQQGERVFLRGSSGSGKSTLLNILCGVTKSETGEVFVLNRDIEKFNSRERDRYRAHHLGVIFQQFNLIPYLSIYENVKLAAYFGGKQTNLMVRITELADALHLSKSLIHQQARHLSVGQQQRVAVMRAFINNPEILLADEPTSALDEKSKDAFLTILMAMLQEYSTTLIMVSHDAAIANYFSREVNMIELNSAAG